MTRTHNHLFTSALAATLLVSAAGCKKEGTDSVMAAANNSLAIQLSEDVRMQVHMAAAAQSGLFKVEEAAYIPACATVLLEETGGGYPKTLTLTYGSSCTDNNGVTRSGSLICVFSGPYDDASTTVEVALVGYTYNQYAISGSHSISVTAANGPYNVNVLDLVIAWDGSDVKWNGTRTADWIAGSQTTYLTPDTSQIGDIMGPSAFADDAWEITNGSGSGNDRNGHPFGYLLASNLGLTNDCRYINSGTIAITSVNQTEALVDYGTGECDNRATLDADGDISNFILP